MNKNTNTFLRVVAMLICSILLIGQIKRAEGYNHYYNFYFTTLYPKYSEICRLTDFRDACDKWFTPVSIIFLIACLFLYIVAWVLVNKNNRAGVKIDIVASSVLFVTLISSFLMVKHMLRAKITDFSEESYIKSYDSNFWVFLILLIVLAIVIGAQLCAYLKVIKSKNDLFDASVKANNIGRIVFAATSIVIIAVSIVFIAGLGKVSSRYSYIFEKYDKDSHVFDEKKASGSMNYPNAVAVRDELYYIDKSSQAIKLLKKDGSIETFYQYGVDNGSSVKHIDSIDYYDGYFYVVWINESKEELARISDEGAAQIIVSADDKSIMFAAVKSSSIYYMTYKDNSYDIYKINISSIKQGDSKPGESKGFEMMNSEGELYLAGYDNTVNSEEWASLFYLEIICDDTNSVRESRSPRNTFVNSKYVYRIEHRDADGADFGLYKYDSEGSERIAEHIRSYVVSEDSIYFVTSEETQGDKVKISLAKMGLDGSNTELIKSYDNSYMSVDFDRYYSLNNTHIYMCDDKLLLNYQSVEDGIKKVETDVIYIR